MSVNSRIMARIRNEFPAPNRKLIIDGPRAEINGIKDHLASIYASSCDFLEDGVMEYVGMTPLTPEEQFHDMCENISRGAGASIKQTAVEHLKFHFLFDSEKINIAMQVPYLAQNTMMVVDGVNYMPMQVLVEKVFSHHGGTITIRVPKYPLHFSRVPADKNSIANSICRRESLTTQIPIAKLHSKTLTKVFMPTIVHYLLAKFGLSETCQRLGVDKTKITFTNELPDDFETSDMVYFEGIKLFKKKTLPEITPIFIGVLRQDLKDPVLRKFVQNLVYILSKHHEHKIEDITDDDAIFIRKYLGAIYYTGRAPEAAMVLNQAADHLYSISKFIDPLTRRRFKQFGFPANDIWELLTWMFLNIDVLFVEKKTQNLYDKRITGLEQAITDTFIGSFNKCMYRFGQDRGKLTSAMVRRKFKIPPAHRSIMNSPSVAQPKTINGNALFTWGTDAVRLGKTKSNYKPNTPELRFHPSWAVVYSLVGYAGDVQGYKGSLNPYLEIDDDGGVIRPAIADQIDDLLEYLPFK